jgi:hypothetical protein
VSGSDGSILWSDKYRPQRPEHLVGNKSGIQNLISWLVRWDAVHIKKTQKVNIPIVLAELVFTGHIC